MQIMSLKDSVYYCNKCINVRKLARNYVKMDVKSIIEVIEKYWKENETNSFVAFIMYD